MGHLNSRSGLAASGPGAIEPLQPGLAGEPLDQTDDEAPQGAMFLPRITEMDGRGGLFVEVAGGIEGFKHQIICVLLRMISEVLNICDRVMKGLDNVEGGRRPVPKGGIYARGRLALWCG